MALPAQKAAGDVITAADHNALIPLVLRVREEQNAATNGGGFTAGSWVKRALNTVALNEITGASLASSVITLPAGVYNVQGWGLALAVDRHKTRLRQTSGTPADLLIGSSEISTGTATTATSSRLEGRITLTTSTTLEFQHQCQTTKTSNGFGAASSFSVNEVYSEIVFTKVG